MPIRSLNNISHWTPCNDCNVSKNKNYSARMIFRRGALRVCIEIWFEFHVVHYYNTNFQSFKLFWSKDFLMFASHRQINLIFLFKFCIFLCVDAIKTDATWRASQTMQSSQQPHHGNFTNHCWCWYVKLYIWCLINICFLNHKSLHNMLHSISTTCKIFMQFLNLFIFKHLVLYSLCKYVLNFFINIHRYYSRRRVHIRFFTGNIWLHHWQGLDCR